MNRTDHRNKKQLEHFNAVCAELAALKTAHAELQEALATAKRDQACLLDFNESLAQQLGTMAATLNEAKDARQAAEEAQRVAEEALATLQASIAESVAASVAHLTQPEKTEEGAP